MDNLIQGKTFLVVDDQEPVRQLVARSLRQLGAGKVLPASNGLTALSVLETEPVDFIISDWNMPKMNGVELLKAVRKQPNQTKVPFLMITAETDRRRVMEVISSGVTDFLVKPFNVKTLGDKITRCFCIGSPELMAEYQQSTQVEAKNAPPEKATLLVVDDMPSNIDVLVNLFQKDYRVKVASSGEQALKICEAAPPDIILLDIMMPGMDGFEVCHRLQQSQDTQGIPVIFLTSRDAAVDMERGFAVGGVDYVVKPSEPSIVRARVKNHLRLKDSRDNLAQELDLLVENSRLKEEMQYMMRHDLKNPLMGMMFHLTELTDIKELPAKAKEHSLAIEASAYRMLALINSSQDLMKIEKGQYIAKQEAVDIAAVLYRLEKDLQGACRDKNLTLSLNFHQTTPVVKGEELLCYVLVANLLKNAVEAALENTQILVQQSISDEKLVLEIKNSGEVPKTIRERFFEKYVSADKDKGTGLGTYSARLMAQVQGGDIRLDCSEAGHTTLVTTLPKWQ